MQILIISSFFIDPTKGGVQRVSSLLFEALMRKGINVYFLVLDGEQWLLKRESVKDSTSSLTLRILERTYFMPERDSFPRNENIEFSAELIQKLGITHCINQTDLFSGVVDWKPAVELKLGRPIFMASVHHNCVGCLAQNYRELRFGGRVNIDRVNGKLGWTKDEILFRMMDRNWVWWILSVLVKRKYKKLFSRVIQGSNRYVLLSESFRNELEDFGVSELDKLVSIPNPSTYSTLMIWDKLRVESDAMDGNMKLCEESATKVQLTELHSELIKRKENRVLFVGRVDHGQKRPDRMMRIFEELHNQFSTWQFDIVGDGDALKELKEYAKNRGLIRVNFHGFQDPKEHYIRSKIFVMTSDYEGLPMTLIEAISCGAVPVVNHCFSAVHEVVPENCGMVVPFGDNNEFIVSVRKLMEDEALRTQFMQNGLRNVEKFNPDLIAEKWIDLFGDMV